MASYLPLLLLAAAFLATASSARIFPAEPLSVMLDAYGNPVIFLREKRAPINRPAIPQRAMMFTGYYRPARRSYGNDQAAGVFAQGNAVSGGSYLGGIQSPHLKNGPEPIDEPEVSSAQAEAAPAEPEEVGDGYGQEDQHQVNEQHNDSGFSTEEQHETPVSYPETQTYDVDAPASAPASPGTEENVDGPIQPPAVLPKPGVSPPAKKGKKTPLAEDEDDDDDLDEDQEPYSPFLPAKGNRRQGSGYVPNLNNLFPMVFSFPGFSRRGGSPSGTPPGVVTAIANSYSTGKGGVASSVATAYGGSPSGKKARRAPVAEE